LSRRASDYLDEAAELERVAARRPRPDEPEKELFGSERYPVLMGRLGFPLLLVMAVSH
jgi:hypothetical protein